MTRQESTSVVRSPMAKVESRLSHVEEWPEFLVGLSSVEKVAYGRYRFHVTQGSETFEIPVAVNNDLHDHRVVWHCLEGPRWDGELKMSEVDPKHTKIHLITTTEPRGFTANVTEWVGTPKDEATLDLQRLELLVASS